MMSQSFVFTKLTVWLCVLLTITFVQCSHEYKENRGWRGKEFLLAFTQNIYDEFPEKLQLHITSDHAGSAKIEIPYVGVSNTIPLNVGLTMYDVDLSLMPSGDIEKKGILVTTTCLVNLYGLHFLEFSSDAFAVLPTAHLSTLYYVSSFLYGFFHSFVVASPYDNNEISIELKLNTASSTIDGVTYYNGQTLNIVLNKFEIYSLRFEDWNAALTSTRISSSKPVALINGDPCSVTPDTLYCSHASEMVLPVTRYRRKYIIPTFFGKEKGNLKVMAKMANTRIYRDGVLHSTISQPGEESTMTLLSDHVLYTTEPVQILMQVLGNDYGDAFLLLIQPVSDYLSRYHFAVFGETFDSFITVIVPAHALDYLTLDGNILTTRLNERTIEAGFQIYVIFSMSISNGAHIMNNEKCPFGLMVYGYSRMDGYGLLAG